MSKRTLILSASSIVLSDPARCCDRWGSKRVFQGINSVLQHVLSSQLNIQLRTFQRLINAPIRYSRDERSCSVAICEQNSEPKGHVTGDRKWISLARQVNNKIWVSPELTPVISVSNLKEASGALSGSVNTKQMWVKRHVAVLLSSSGLTGREQHHGKTDPAVFLHDSLDGSRVVSVMLQLWWLSYVIPLFSFSLVTKLFFFSWV